MTLLYADPSALIRAYFVDEPDHAELRALLLEGTEPVITSEIGRIEVASAVRSAARSGRLRRWRGLLDRIDADCQEDGPIALLRLRPDVVFPIAYRLVLDHRVRTLDGVHLAVATEECPVLAGNGEIGFVTRDRNQAKAATALGLIVQ